MVDGSTSVDGVQDTPVIEGETVCVRCGYILRGLAKDGRCPECGEAVAVSIRGRRLADADRGWVRSLVWGAALAGVSPIVLLVTGFVISQLCSDGRIPFHLCFVVVFFLGAMGLWLVSRPEPGGPYFDDRKWLRRVMRAVAAGAGPLGVTFGLLELVWRSGLTIVGIGVGVLQSYCLMVAFPGALIATMVLLPRYLAVLARRLPSPRLSRHGHLAMLGLPGVVITFVAVITFTKLLTSGSGISLAINGFAFVLLCWPGVYGVVWAICVWRRCRKRAA